MADKQAKSTRRQYGPPVASPTDRATQPGNAEDILRNAGLGRETGNDPNVMLSSTLDRLNRYASLPYQHKEFETCIAKNHCRPKSAKTRIHFDGTVGMTFNIGGPSGKQSLRTLRTNTHSGRIVIAVADAKGQLPIDVAKNMISGAARKAFREALKDKAKDEVYNAVLNPKNYIDVTIMAQGMRRIQRAVHSGRSATFKVPDHKDVQISVRHYPTLPVFWELHVEGADYLRAY